MVVFAVDKVEFGTVNYDKSSSNKKRSKLIVLFFLVIAIAVLLVYYISLMPGGPRKNRTVYTPEQIESIARNSLPSMRNVLLSKNKILSGCIAATSNDVSVCDDLDSAGKKTECVDHFDTYNLFVSTLDDQCDSLQGIQKTRCDALRFESCEDLTGDDNKICNAVINKDESLCRLAADFTNVPEECESLITNFWAMKENDAETCNSLSKLYRKEMCRAFVSRNCDDVLNTIAMDFIYSELSRTLYDTVNTELCSNIIHEEIRDMCNNIDLTYDDIVRSI